MGAAIARSPRRTLRSLEQGGDRLVQLLVGPLTDMVEPYVPLTVEYAGSGPMAGDPCHDQKLRRSVSRAIGHVTPRSWAAAAIASWSFS